MRSGYVEAARHSVRVRGMMTFGVGCVDYFM